MSAVIYAAIVVIWLIVLVPMWLRRHEAALDEKSSERFDGAMRVLARRQRPAGVDRRYRVAPRRSAATPVHAEATEPMSWRERRALKAAQVREARQQQARAGAEGQTPSAQSARRRPTAAERRRRTLLVLLGLSAFCALMGFAGLLPVALQLLPELLLLGFVVHLRRQAKLLAARRRRPTSAGAARPAPVRPVPEPLWTPAASGAQTGDTRWNAEGSSAGSESYEEPVAAAGGVSASADVYSEFGRDAETASYGRSEPVPSSTWEPRPVPPPTYSLKPPAPSSDGRWLAVDDVDGELSEGDDDTELDMILDPGYGVGYDDRAERRRAVND